MNKLNEEVRCLRTSITMINKEIDELESCLVELKNAKKEMQDNLIRCLENLDEDLY